MSFLRAAASHLETGRIILSDTAAALRQNASVRAAHPGG